jgi:hypothetical protein
MYYVMIVKNSPIEEICGITESKYTADQWKEDGMNGIAPCRIIREFESQELNESHIEHGWSAYNVKQRNS